MHSIMRLMLVKSVESQCPPVDVVWKSADIVVAQIISLSTDHGLKFQGPLLLSHRLVRSKKEDLRRIASELELCVSDKLTVLDLMDLIKNCDRYKNDPDSVHELANLIIEERKYDESQQLELEKIREKSKLDLEIARIRANDKDNNTEVNCNDSPFLWIL
ncbi:hypothetical protein TNCV_4447261 [Trichonephila clavipes]|nr:hypothetical protein TNCV_4447261 [Trichonephila clavipes]